MGLLPLCYSKVAQNAYLAIVFGVSASLLLTGIDRFLIDAYLDLEWHLLRERNKVKLVDAGLLYDYLIMDHFIRRI